MPQNQLMPGPLANAGASLVGAFMGGDATQEAARQKAQMGIYAEQSAEASLDQKMTAAMLERDKRKAQQGIAQDIVANGGDPLSANVQANAMIGGFANLEQAQKYDIRGQALNAAMADPDLSPMNARLAVLAGKPLDTYKISGGNTIRDNYGDNAQLGTTAIGQSTIGANNALAASRGADVGYKNMRTAAGAWNPNTGKGRSAPEAKAMIAAFEKSMGRPLKPNEIESVYAGGDVAFTDEHGDGDGTPGWNAPMKYDGENVPGTPWSLPRVVPRVTNNGSNTAITKQPAKDAAVGNQPSPLAPSVPAKAVAGFSPVTPAAIAKLKANPDMRRDFDEKFGPGTSAKVLGF